MLKYYNFWNPGFHMGKVIKPKLQSYWAPQFVVYRKKH